MKVNDGNTPIQLDAYIRQLEQNRQNPQPVRQEQTGVQGTRDKVELSSAAKETQRAIHQLGESGVVNKEMVQKVKTEVEAGTYKVVGHKVATGMLKESFENDLILHKINARA